MADPIRRFRHFREVPETLWRWPDFSPPRSPAAAPAGSSCTPQRSTPCRRCATGWASR